MKLSVTILSWYVFLNSSGAVTEDDLEVGINELLVQNTALYESWTESLPAYQMRYLRAVADGIHEGFSSAEVIGRYRLGSSANVVALKKALLDKNLIYTEDKKVYLSDPVMGMWLKK